MSKKIIESYDYNEQKKLHSHLNKMLNYQIEQEPEHKIFKLKQVGVMDLANVIMVVALTDRAKKILRYYIDSYHKPHKIPDLDYKNSKQNGKYSMSYSKWMFNFITCLNEKTDGSIKISCKFDYPITIENDDWKIILAPRVDG